MANDRYPEAYNQWAGNPAGSKPDFTRCCESVTPNERGGYWHQHQCNRKRGYGPDGAYCKQHDPAAKAARDKASHDKYIADMNKRRYQWHGPKLFAVLQQIADGHNDARGLAKDTIEEFERGAIR